ncbi:ISL3 family transposase [Fundicoccus culcitae]|uniref:ISL3 family transposase n=1 Tax=Fundicoccus culcitae TaxID=2969821 RepID=A0ABY5P781_9LACT|nr:ISL3 family transposase [Fundicoccus culcitae]UUX33559.1 ISL3 family transposase [Fundicoccus culcitae]UUX33562.1 ISL3 family transposase [Fundicoccus culcitae]UUX34592.1 ISL3 family transposase [Fundicoccus culcitae]
MANAHYIAKLLNITDERIEFSDTITHEMKRNVHCKVLEGRLSYPLKACLNCGIINRSTKDMIKYGFDTSTITLTHINFQPILLKLKKQRYRCQHCSTTSTVTTSLVNKGCFISNDIKRTIVMELTQVQSMKLIAQHLFVSRHTVATQLKRVGSSLAAQKRYLPEHLGIDEFKSVNSVTQSMSCILMDTHNHTLVDILPDRTQNALRDYFMRFTYESRQQVKTVTMDMYGPYYHFLQQIFPNAKMIIDRFHLVQLLNRTLNQERIRLMNDIRNRRPRDYRKLKQQWKLILKNRDDLEFTTYQTHRLYDGLVTEKSMVNYLLNLDKRFEQVYHLVNDLKSDIAQHNYKAFERDLYETRKYQLPRKVRTTIQTFIYYLPAIKNSLTYTLSNGIIEGTNNKIKNIKRSGYGYRNFSNLRYRILITQNLIKKDKEIRPLLFKDEISNNKRIA